MNKPLPIKRHLLAVLILMASSSLFAQSDLRGFSQKSSVLHQQLEQRFDQQLSSINIGKTIKELSAKPHYLGSLQGKAVAESILKKFKDYGWDAKIETYQVLFPTPKIQLLELTAPDKFTAALKESALLEDATSGQSGQLPAYNAWGADGDVSGELIYVNYGLPDDYERLDKLGINVAGKIVIVRCGKSWRGIKPKLAYEHGAIGCIIYSDPKEDGYYQGGGSVMDVVLHPGDPLTPNIAATKEAGRIKKEDAETIMKIPVLPISYRDALPLLSALDGPVAPEEWRGSLPITYHIGAGNAKVRLKVASSWDIVPAYNVIARIKGAVFPDQWVIRGNHHDAWVNGAADPISGLSVLLEEAKAIGTLVKAGYKPKRTLVYCAWDGEEQGLLGSTEWVEDHAEELSKKAVAYINTDGNGRGFLESGGSHSLEQLMDDIAKEIPDPQSQVSIFERSKAHKIVTAPSVKLKKALLAKDSITLDALGTGSDYSAFLQHLGIASLNLGFAGEDKDPDFIYGVTLAKTVGRVVLRLAEAEVLPFDFKNLKHTIAGYVKEIEQLTNDLRENNEVENLLINEGKYQQAADPSVVFYVPKNKFSVPEIDFKVLNDALTTLELSANQIQNTSYDALKEKKIRLKLNEVLYQAERKLLNDEGLPFRPWYKHTIYAPGFYTGYGVKTLPGIREAIEQGEWSEASKQIEIAAKQINNLSIYLNSVLRTSSVAVASQ